LAHNGFVCTLDALAGRINVICPAVGQAVRPSRDALISAMTSLSGDSSLSAGTGCGAGLTVWIDECGDEVAARPPAAAQQNGVNCIDSPQGCSSAPRGQSDAQGDAQLRQALSALADHIRTGTGH